MRFLHSIFANGRHLENICKRNGLNLISSLRNVDSTSRESQKLKNLDDLIFFPANSARLPLQLLIVCDLWFMTLWLSNLTQWSPQKTEMLCSLNNFKKPFSLKYTLWQRIMHGHLLFFFCCCWLVHSPRTVTLCHISLGKLFYTQKHQGE